MNQKIFKLVLLGSLAIALCFGFLFFRPSPNTLAQSQCQEGAVRCTTGAVENNTGWIEKCVNNFWEFQKYCAGACKDGTSCNDSIEQFDASCATVDANVQPGGIAFKPQGTACSKNGFLGACDGLGHCLVAPAGSGSSACYERCQAMGKAGGVCANPNEGRPINYCSAKFCLTNLEQATDPDRPGADRSFIFCPEARPDSDDNCYCYNLQNSICSPGCEQRCAGGLGCQALPAENCCNNLDDDFDGMIDAEDSDCNKAKGSIALKAGLNNVCWQAKPWGYYRGSSSQYDYTSPLFSCPAGYWLKLAGSYIVRYFEELYVNGDIWPSGEGSLSGVFPSNLSSFKYASGGGVNGPEDAGLDNSNLGVLVSNLECVLPQNIDCGKCGDGVFWGLFNLCDKDECSSLSGGQCFYQPGSLGGKCYAKTFVNFTVRDVIEKQPINGLTVKLKETDLISCQTKDQGACSLELGLGAKYTAYIDNPNYQCLSGACIKYFEVNSSPMSVVLEPNKIVACSDSDASANSPSGKSNYYEKGTVRETSGLFADVCQSQQSLREYYCSNDKAVFEEYPCSLGCSDGRCLKPTDQNMAKVIFKVSAKNSFDVKNPVSGVIVAVQGGKGYSCLTGYDGQCPPVEMAKDSYTALVSDPLYLCQAPDCPKNFTAVGLDDIVEIVLQKKQMPVVPGSAYCHDTDGGQNYTEAGAVEVDRGLGESPQTFLDYCSGDAKKVFEGYCDGDFLGVKSNACVFGCQQGACLVPVGVNFKVIDGADGQAIEGANIKVETQIIYNNLPPNLGSCQTIATGKCSLDILAGLKVKATAEKTSDGYLCLNNECSQNFIVDNSTVAVTLKLRKETAPVEPAIGDVVYKIIFLPITSDDLFTAAPIAGALGKFVSENTVETSCLSDSQGICLMKNLAVGQSYQKTFSANGYKDYGPLQAVITEQDIVRGINSPLLILMSPVASGDLEPADPVDPIALVSGSSVDIGALRVDVPAGAVSNVGNLSITPISNFFSAPDSSIGLMAGSQAIGGAVFDVKVNSSNGQEVSQFSKEIVLTFRYVDQQIQGANESTIAAYFYNEMQKIWQKFANQTLNTANNTLTVRTNHLTLVELSITGGTPATQSGVGVSGRGEPCCSDDNCLTGGNLKCVKDCFKDKTKAGSSCKVFKDDKTGEITGSGDYSLCAPKDAEVVCNFSSHSDLLGLINEIMKWLFYLAVITAPLLIIIGALLFMTSGGEPSKINKARAIIVWAAIGLAAILFARGIYSVLNSILKG